ncbi:MAG: phosphoethanolamine transferase [Victivallales bacterium]|nr:phosphoethanolamine transferase [Victivallales bacterium]
MKAGNNIITKINKNFDLWEILYKYIKIVNYKYFIIWEIFNLLLFSILYLKIHEKDRQVYLIATALALCSITAWSFILSTLTYNKIKVLLQYCVCLLMPYFILIADILNQSLKNQAYFLSQVYVYFMLGTIFMIINIVVLNLDLTKKFSIKVLAFLWFLICSVLLHFFILISINALLGNVSFDYDAIVAICQTNFKEAVGYFTRLNHRYQLLTYTIISFLVILIINMKSLFQPYREKKVNLCIMSILAVFFTVYFVITTFIFQKKLYSSNIFKLMGAPISYFQENRKFKEKRANYDAFIREKFRNEPENPDATGVFVIIIGESLNRNYMSAYDYHVDTTPFQRKMVEDHAFYLFQYPYSAYAQTIRCIAYMLTNQNQYDNKTVSLSNSISLFEIARYNKFTTRWFSAQGTCLLLDSPTALLASSADYSFNLPMARSHFDHKITDMDLMEFFPEKLSDKELIVIQLMGSHYPYPNVFPSDFMKDSSLSDYEKSVCYNDLVVKKIFEFFRDKNASVILYLSDHSENIEKGLGHDPRMEVFTQDMTEVPFWLYVSPDYASKHNELAIRLERASKRVFTTDLLFEFMISLMNIKSSFMNSSNDILSDNYFLTDSNALTLGGKVKLQIKLHSNP